MIPRRDGLSVVITVELSDAQAQALAEHVRPPTGSGGRREVYDEEYLEATGQAFTKLAAELADAGYEGWTWFVPWSEG